MKQFILIENTGELDPRAVFMLGASTKRNDKTKIGRFGSGFKYALAKVLRDGLDIRIFSHETEIIVGTFDFELKGISFKGIMVDGKETSLTTEAGPDWSSWRVIREFWCNAIDEGNEDLRKGILEENISGTVGKTRIYLEVNDEINKVIENWDIHFSDERTDGTHFNKEFAMYPATDGHILIYRKGIRVHRSEETALYHYELGSCDINEERELTNSYYLRYSLAQNIARYADVAIAHQILKRAGSEKTLENQLSFGDYPLNDNWVEAAHLFDNIILNSKSGYYLNRIKNDNSAFVSEELGKALVAKGILVFGLTAGGKSREWEEKEDLHPKEAFLLKDVTEHLQNVIGYQIKYPIKIVSFENKERLGLADTQSKTILISDKMFNMGRRELAITIMEENEHLVTEFGDETRTLQNHLFQMWLSALEEKAGYFF